MRFFTGLQYKTAAIAGMITQFFWGIMQILLFRAFYEADVSAFPMSFQEFCSYIWLQQAFLAMFMTWSMELDIFDLIISGGISYELCRPINLYSMWFARGCAYRLSQAVLRCIPILLLAVFLKKPYGIGAPATFLAMLGFILSMFLGFLVVVAFCMLLYISAFYTISALGIRVVWSALVEFLSGAIIPLPFLPDKIRQIVELLPFASMQDTPFRIYSGNITGIEIIKKIVLQAIWAILLVELGKLFLKKSLKRIVVQGG